MLQVLIYHLTWRGLNTSCICCVCDYHHDKFFYSLYGAIQTTLHDDPITLTIYPNFVISLSNNHLDKFLKVLIQTNGFNMKFGSTHLTIQTCIMYRYVNTFFPIVHHGCDSGSSLVIKSNPHSQTIKIKSISWDQVKMA